MDIFQVFQALVRRWYVFLPLAALAALGGLRAVDRIAPTYTASASLLLVAPTTTAPEVPAGGGPINPLLQAGAATVVQVLTLAGESNERREELMEAGLSSDYRIKTMSRLPIMQIQVTAGSPDSALASIEGLVESLREDVQGRQDAFAAPSTQRYTIEPIAAPDLSGAARSGSRRMLVLVAGVGMVLAVGLTVFLDGALTLRRRRQRLPSPAPARTAAGPLPPGGPDREDSKRGPSTGDPAEAPELLRRSSQRGVVPTTAPTTRGDYTGNESRRSNGNSPTSVTPPRQRRADAPAAPPARGGRTGRHLADGSSR